jgi:hypothetical protein
VQGPGKPECVRTGPLVFYGLLSQKSPGENTRAPANTEGTGMGSAHDLVVLLRN